MNIKGELKSNVGKVRGSLIYTLQKGILTPFISRQSEITKEDHSGRGVKDGLEKCRFRVTGTP